MLTNLEMMQTLLTAHSLQSGLAKSNSGATSFQWTHQWKEENLLQLLLEVFFFSIYASKQFS